MTSVEIPTEHGPAVLWWDDRGDCPGWVLRYHLGEEVGQRHLDEPLDSEDEDTARRDALLWLGQQGIGAGRRLTTAEAAARAGVTRAGWRSLARRWGVAPGGHYDARTPWYWESQALAARAEHPRRERVRRET